MIAQNVHAPMMTPEQLERFNAILSEVEPVSDEIRDALLCLYCNQSTEWFISHDDFQQLYHLARRTYIYSDDGDEIEVHIDNFDEIHEEMIDFLDTLSENCVSIYTARRMVRLLWCERTQY